ncbi:reductive dehalogenase [Dehalobacter sp. TBBPA1]|uniref:reductive dehalogenase n=1 Tax=Dehalobacter sp. TBBPA1 TaxID=3235037 RepID=UPI0034A5A0AE
MQDSRESMKNGNTEISRRTFFKGAGLLAATAAMTQLPFGENQIADAASYNSIDDVYQISKDIKRFNQKNDMFCRVFWDAKFIPPPKPTVNTSTPGYSIRDIAAGTAAWTVANSLGTYFGWRSGDEGLYSWNSLGVTKPPQQPWQASPEEAAHAVKLFAKDNGAGMTGITTVDSRWIYSEYYHRGTRKSGGIEWSDTAQKPEILEDGTKVIPSRLKYCIVMLHPMPYEMVKTAPSAVGHAGTGVGYSMMAYCAASMAEFIRGLGYTAIPMGNDTTISVPLAIQAGLGEIGRNGLLVTPIGPGVRISKVITDLPLTVDKPINLGVRSFCQSCKRCAVACPSQAISHDDMTTEGPNISSMNGIKKWYVDCEKCRVYWSECAENACIRCVAACPFNKPQGYWTHSLGSKIAPIVGGTTLATIDDWMGYGKQLSCDDYWKKPIK